jgi:hypothetical protein
VAAAVGEFGVGRDKRDLEELRQRDIGGVVCGEAVP